MPGDYRSGSCYYWKPSPAPGIIAAYAYLPGDKALGVSPWEGHCYPEAFRRLQVSYRQKYLAGQHQ